MSDRIKRLTEKYRSLDEANQARMLELDERVDKGGKPVPMTAAEIKEVEDAEAELQRLGDTITAERKASARRAGVEAAAAEDMAPANKDVTGAIRDVTKRAGLVPATPVIKLTTTQKMGIFTAGVARRHHNPDRNVLKHIEEMGFGQLIEEWGGEQKVLSTLTGAAGGFGVPTVLSTEFINWLYPKSAFLSGNPIRIDLSAGNLHISGGNASATASYRAEAANIAYSDPTVREVTLAAKNLAAITALTNELINRSPLMIDTWVQTDLQRAFTQTMDLALLRGDGTSNTPTGIRNAITSGQRVAVAAGVSPSLTQVESDLRLILILYAASNIPQGRPHWILHPRVKLYLAAQRDGNGNIAWPGLSLSSPTLKGWPVIESTQVPSTLGAGTNESEIYLADFDHIYFGDTQAMTLDVSREAAYDVSGTLHSAFSKNQTVIRLVGSHDVAVRYNAAVAVLTAVQWGA